MVPKVVKASVNCASDAPPASCSNADSQKASNEGKPAPDGEARGKRLIAAAAAVGIGIVGGITQTEAVLIGLRPGEGDGGGHVAEAELGPDVVTGAEGDKLRRVGTKRVKRGPAGAALLLHRLLAGAVSVNGDRRNGFAVDQEGNERLRFEGTLDEDGAGFPLFDQPVQLQGRCWRVMPDREDQHGLLDHQP